MSKILSEAEKELRELGGTFFYSQHLQKEILKIPSASGKSKLIDESNGTLILITENYTKFYQNIFDLKAELSNRFVRDCCKKIQAVKTVKTVKTVKNPVPREVKKIDLTGERIYCDAQVKAKKGVIAVARISEKHEVTINIKKAIGQLSHDCEIEAINWANELYPNEIIYNDAQEAVNHAIKYGIKAKWIRRGNNKLADACSRFWKISEIY